MLKLVVFIPETHLEAVKEALFAAGAGRQGNYDCCCWQVRGEGKFRRSRAAGRLPARKGADRRGRVPRRVLCPAERREAVTAALGAAPLRGARIRLQGHHHTESCRGAPGASMTKRGNTSRRQPGEFAREAAGLGDGCSEVERACNRSQTKDVVGPHPMRCRPRRALRGLDCVVDPFQQDTLVGDWDTGLDQPRAGGALSGVISSAWLNCVLTHTLPVRPRARASPGVTRMGMTHGTRVPMRTASSWGRRARVSTQRRMRVSVSSSGSPPERIASCTPGWACR